MKMAVAGYPVSRQPHPSSRHFLHITTSVPLFQGYPFFFSVRSVSIRMDGVMGCLLEGEEYGALQGPIRLLGSQEGIFQGMLQMKDTAGDEEAEA